MYSVNSPLFSAASPHHQVAYLLQGTASRNRQQTQPVVEPAPCSPVRATAKYQRMYDIDIFPEGLQAYQRNQFQALCQVMQK